MKRGYRRPGATLPELVALLGLTSILLAMAGPAFGTARDRWAARAARDHTAALISHTRNLATLHGSATLRIDTVDVTVRIEAPTGQNWGSVEPIGARYGVRIRGAGSGSLEFDALGLGRLANRTLEFHRGGAATRLTVSSYGRPRRW